MQEDWKAAIKLLVEQEEAVFDRGTKQDSSVTIGKAIDTAISSMPEKSCRVTMIGASQCTISALEE